MRLGLPLVLVASVAHANGRPPVTDGIHFRPGDPHSLYVSSTFGLLISHDDGCTFDWVCEANIGYGGLFDPKYAIATDGTIFATTFKGLRVSRDGGCSFTSATASLPVTDPDRLADIWIDAIDIGPTGEVWVGTAESGRPNEVFASSDNGATFHARGLLSPAIWWKSVKVAPSNAQRIYVTGYQVAGPRPGGGQMSPTAHLFRSDDDGAHWTESSLAGVGFGSTPVLIVTAVDPTNADRLYAISLGAHPPSGDRMYRSDDGGKTLIEALATTDPITGVVIRDAQTVMVSTQRGGSYVAIAGAAFAALASQPQLACLGQGESGLLYGCAANWGPDYMAVATSSDGAATWSKVWRFVDLHGPIACPDGTAERDVCDLQQWPALKAQFGATGRACGSGGAPATAPPVKNKPGRGCCDGGGGASSLAVLALAGLRRRRR